MKKANLFSLSVLSFFAITGYSDGALAYNYNDYYNEYNNVSYSADNSPMIKANDVTIQSKNVNVEEKTTREWRFPVGVFAGTSGIGVKAGFEYKYIGIYGTASTFGKWTVNMTSVATSLIGDTDGLSIASANACLKIQDYGVDLRIKPFNGAFHIDIGYHYMNYQLFMNAGASINIDEFITMNDSLNLDNLSLSGVASMKIAKGWKPYFGLGWDIRLFYQFYLTIDLGVMYTGKWDAPSINIDYSKAKSKIEQAVQDKADEVINSSLSTATTTGGNINYNDIKKQLTDLGISGSDVDGYAREVLGLQENESIPNEISQADVRNVATTSTESIYQKMDNEIAKVNGDLKKNWNDMPSKITNYAKIWPVVKIGFTYKF